MDVLHALDASPGAVLQAPPGAGKTSTVPLALLAHNPWYLQPDHQCDTSTSSPAGKTVLVLEPRRVAAKAAARRMAALLGERVGETVGYRVRLETRVSKATRIEVVTEGAWIGVWVWVGRSF
jgi:ATP-dependent helicase HrpB